MLILCASWNKEEKKNEFLERLAFVFFKLAMNIIL